MQTTIYELKLHGHATAQDYVLPITRPTIELAREARVEALAMFPEYKCAIIKATTTVIESVVE